MISHHWKLLPDRCWCPGSSIPSESEEQKRLSQLQHLGLLTSAWWFQTFFIFHNIWDNPSHWLIFFKMVKTTTIQTWWVSKMLRFSLCKWYPQFENTGFLNPGLILMLHHAFASTILGKFGNIVPGFCLNQAWPLWPYSRGKKYWTIHSSVKPGLHFRVESVVNQ